MWLPVDPSIAKSLLSNCVSISEARFAPILAKYKLNAFAISLEFDRVRPLCTKLGGRSHFFFVSTQGFINSAPCFLHIRLICRKYTIEIIAFSYLYLFQNIFFTAFKSLFSSVIRNMGDWSCFPFNI